MCTRRTSADRSRGRCSTSARITGLRGIRRGPSGWSIGAATTWTDVLRADLPPLFDALKRPAREVGGVQIQNAGTVAGNLCNASPAADGTPVLMALDAAVVLRSTAGERRVAGGRFRARQPAHRCAPDELVVSIEIPARSERARSVFLKLGGRRYLTISMTMVALVVDADAAGAIDQARAVASAAARRARGACPRSRPGSSEHVSTTTCPPSSSRRPRAADADRRPARERRLSPRRDRDLAAPRPRAAEGRT